MSSAKITLIGLYNYDHELFNGFSYLPDEVDRDTLIDTVIMRGGEYEVIYPNSDLLKELIGTWSKQYNPVIANWLKATTDIAEINPLENYDRYEDWSDNSKTDTTNNMVGSGSTTGNDTTTANGSVTGTDTVSAFNDDDLINDTGTSQENTTETNSQTTTNSQTNTLNTGNSKTDSTHTAHIHGNIGVTTAGAMYREFYDVIAKYGNIYDSVATIFLQSFVIPLL